MGTLKVTIVVEVPAIGLDSEGFLGQRPHGNGDAYREAALELLREDLVKYVDQAYVDGDITEVVRRHIVPGDVCQIGISGNEKLRYIGGPLIWVTSDDVTAFDAQTEWGERLTETGLRDMVARLASSVLNEEEAKDETAS